MKRIGILSIACAMVLAVGCNGAEQPRSDTVGTAGVSGAVEGFTQKAAEDGMAEVQLGQLASERASSPDVKNFAQMMVRDHSKASDELKQIATRYNVQLPTQLNDEHRELVEKLRQRQGPDFDREYINAMVDGHDDAVELLDGRAKDAGKPTGDVEAAVNDWAAKTLPTVQQHLRQAREIQQRLNDKGPNRTN